MCKQTWAETAICAGVTACTRYFSLASTGRDMRGVGAHSSHVRGPPDICAACFPVARCRSAAAAASCRPSVGLNEDRPASSHAARMRL